MAKLALPKPNQLVFSSREFAQQNGLSLPATSQRLHRLEKIGVVTQLTRGIWYQPQQAKFHRFAAIPYLLNTEQGYLSFLSALSFHGMIEQIPAITYIATTGYTRSLQSPLGRFDFLKVSPRMMTSGVFWDPTQRFLIADPEKALLDTFYIATRRGNRFKKLPELDLSKISKKKFLSLVKEQVRSKPIANAILERAK